MAQKDISSQAKKAFWNTWQQTTQEHGEMKETDLVVKMVGLNAARRGSTANSACCV